MTGHGHGHRDGPAPLSPTAAKVVIGILTIAAAAVAIGMFLLWPQHRQVAIPLEFQNLTGGAVQTEAGTVLTQTIGPCGSPSAGSVFVENPIASALDYAQCDQNVVSIDSGPNKGARTLFEYSPGPGTPQLAVGDQLRITRQIDSTGTTKYGFNDYERSGQLILLAAVFAIVVIAVASWRGLRALAGIFVAFAVLVGFLLPALLDGKPAVPVALVSAAAILFAVLYLAHGVSLRTSSALVGTLSALLLSALLSWFAIKFSHITGLSDDSTSRLQLSIGHISIAGLILAGFIIGSLGVLNDVTITQASTVFELAELDNSSSRKTIFIGAMRVGRDHIASTVYTLVLAYAGSALPLLLLFSVAGRSLTDVLTSDQVAIELARSFVGGIALALSVPLTTFIAVVLARPQPGKTQTQKTESRHSKL
ncbi:MAG: YibE/F family protein [Mycobacteriaceae bacterium]